MKRQIFFDKNNMDQIFLSPYVEIYGLGTKNILFYQQDNNKKLLLKSENCTLLNNLVNKLLNGINKEEFIELLLDFGITDGERIIEKYTGRGLFE